MGPQPPQSHVNRYVSQEENLEFSHFMESNGDISAPPGDQGEGKASGRTAGGGGGSLEKLSREELITKCRSLLILAQKAKTAKDEIALELKQVKIAAKNAESAAIPQKVEEESSALREMVANLTEGKVALTTKIESLQRQLKVASSEVDCLQELEQKLLLERNTLEAENIQLKRENKKNLDKLQEFQDSSAMKSELLEKAWETEKMAFQEKVENLQAQIGQVDILKMKCKKFLQEKSAIEKELEKQQKLAAKGLKIQGELNCLKEEKKASDIILESSRNDKKALEDKVKSFESQVQSLKKLQEEKDAILKSNQDSIKELETKLKENESSVLDSENYVKELQEQNMKVQLVEKVLENTNTKLRTECEAAISRVNTLQEELKVELDKSRHLEQLVEEFETQKTQHIAEIECSKEKILEIEKNYQQKNIELQKIIEERNDTERSMQEEIGHLKSKLEELVQEKIHDEVRVKQFCVDIENLKMELSAMTESSNIAEKEKTDLIEKLKAQEEENRKLIEHLKQKDNEHVDFTENKTEFDYLAAQVNKLKFEVEQLTEEKIKYLKNSADVENEISCLRKNLEDAQKEKSSFDTELCKIASEVEQGKKSVEEERNRADHLTMDIKELKSQNSELIARVEQLQKEAENAKLFLGELQNTGMSLTSLCKNVYPSLSKTLLPVDQEDVLVNMQSIKEVLAAALTKRENFTPEGDILNIVEALEQVQEQSKRLIMSRDSTVCDSLSSSFDSINKSLMTFYIHAVGLLDIEKSTSVEEMWKIISSLFAKLCEIVKEEMLKLNNATNTVEELRKEVNHFENVATEAVKEREMLSQKLMDSLNQNAIIITEKNEQLENHNNIIAEYEKSQKQLKEFFEAEKITLNEKISNLEEMVLSRDTVRAELEGLLASGNNQNEEIINDLRQQLIFVKEECKAMSKEHDESAVQIKNLQELLEKQDKDLLSLSTEKEVLLSEKIVIKQENDFLKSTVEDVEGKNAANEIKWLDEKQDLEKKLAMISQEKIMLEKEYSSLNESIILGEENASREKTALEEKLNSIIKDLEMQLQEAGDIRAENVLLNKNIQELQLKKEDLIEEVNNFQNYLKVAEDKIQSLISEKEDLEKKLKDADNHKLQLTSSIEASAGRCEELLAELNDMNKVLRERGERISRLEDSNKEKSQELERTTLQLKELQTKMSNREAELASKQEQLQTITEKLQTFSSDPTVTSPVTNNQQFRELEEKVKDLEQEKTNLKKIIQSLENELSSSRENAGNGHDAQSEVMSTSTIGRAEDTQRMKELEDTFEERYMKLKSVAIKLKKRVAELTAQLNSSEETRSKLATEKEDLKKKVDVGVKDSIKAASKNIQVLQGEIDRLQDEVDSKTKELKEQGKQLNSAAEQLASAKSDLAVAQDENGILHRTVKNLEETISSQEDAAGSLRGQITSLEKRLGAELQKQQALEDRRKKAEERMEEERQRAAQFVKELEEAKQDSKTRSLLDLEMRDYELTLEELNGQLRDKDSCLADLQAAVEREKGRSSSLQDQLTHLTTQETTERERADKMKKLLLEHKTQLAELHLAQEAQSATKEMDRVTIEQLTQEVEKLKLAIAELTCEKVKLEETGKRSKLSAERQIEVLEDQLMKHKIEVQQLVAERDTIQNEFEGYKVRATSVLRQKNRPPEINVSELQSEKDQLQTDCEAAQLKVQQLQSELSALRAEYTYIQSEKDGNARQVSSLSEELNRRESSHHEKIAILESKMEGKITEYQRIIASMSNQNEAMSNNFKKQLDTLKQTHSREVEQLATKLEESEDKLWQLKNTISNSVPATPSNVSTTLATTSSAPNLVRSESDHSMPGMSHSNAQQHRRQLSHGDEPRIDVTNMVREEGEGSEWVEPVHRSPGKQRGYSPPPLEQLINSPLTSQDDNVSIASINTDATGKEMARLEAKLNAGEMRIQQLTTLLHESEAENAKLAQLSDALKEEIRRSVRNELREKHMENMEYMKNVILKFLVLKNGEERKHLVPVLKTVLQLSPTETSQLELLALGNDGDGGSQAGWGNYLHLWSSR
nr:GRIP and coiled-coil domain-containing protein 2-like isoform X2 [Procambarus clarkii]